MSFKVVPVNKKLLLEKFVLDAKEPIVHGFYAGEDKITYTTEFYRVLDKSADCDSMVEPGDLVSTEIVTPIGTIDGKKLFMTHERSLNAIIKEEND